MSKPFSFVPIHNLSNLLRRPGGLTASEAVDRADAAIESIRDRCVTRVDERINALVELCRLNGEPLRQEVLAMASEIYSIAALFDLREMARAAGSLCDLILLTQTDDPDPAETLSQKSAPPMFYAAVLVHVDALRRLRHPDRGGDSPAGRAAILEGLSKVASKFVSPDRMRDALLCSTRDTREDEQLIDDVFG